MERKHGSQLSAMLPNWGFLTISIRKEGMQHKQKIEIDCFIESSGIVLIKIQNLSQSDYSEISQCMSIQQKIDVDYPKRISVDVLI